MAWEVVEATMNRLNPVVRAMVGLLWYSGMRPGEACKLKPGEVDRTGDMWLYRPGAHKAAYRNKSRTVAIGPRAQEYLRDWLDAAEPGSYVFRPAAGANRVGEAAKRYRPRYTAASFYTAVRRAAQKAGVAAWHPNQMRHAARTIVRKEFGLEAAQVVLGHSRADVTQVYANRDEAKAVDVARRIG